ncbi:ShlB/FhaC/HecB family hemolysin secretion/activation protein [Thiomicrospira cyclica]|uniref:Polypeptide-transport-associated domain protein ShlB-type n=1 Tax=Thiomicrospira cyclica (strain DSM 14477 / JCM 11371 / ALM1) TaxID=717773 RepID=F6DAI0_THICA|nr:ShlB/FhaC/HecB family hemolysin secretion/activation protein [Thiomicrospira cyclica]AEG32236.1 Polypeptide-transport-associated domain protein ShlB-type [Thiomicrospira cyclica ALM1]
MAINRRYFGQAKPLTGALALAFAGLLASSPAVAQTQPDAGSILQQLTPQIPQIAPALPSVESRQDDPLAPIPAAGPTVLITSMTIVDVDGVLTEEEKFALVGDAAGQRLDYAGMLSYRDKVTAYLRAKGYLMARAYLPRQDVTDGTVEIHILIGRLDEQQSFLFEREDANDAADDARPSSELDVDFLTRMAAAHLTPGEALSEAPLNASVLKMSDLHGINATATLTQGAELGELRVRYQLQTEPRHNLLAWVDNQGNRSTGETQAAAQYRLVNPSGKGDQLSLFANHSNGVDLANLSYATPLNPHGLMLNLGYLNLDYRVMTELGRTQQSRGSVQGVNAGLTYALIRSRTHNLYLSGEFSKQQLLDEQLGERTKQRDKHSLKLGLNGDWLDGRYGGGFNSWSFNWTQGQLDLPIGLDADQGGFQTAGAYTKLNLSFNRIQRLNADWTASLAYRGQRAFKNLDSSEQMSLGGVSGVRAYPGSEASGDEADLINFELRYELPQTGWFDSAQLTAFYDIGWVQLHKDLGNQRPNNQQEINAYSLQGAGLGIRMTRRNNLMLQLQLASKIGTNPGVDSNGNDADGRTDDTRVWAQLVKWF